MSWKKLNNYGKTKKIQNLHVGLLSHASPPPRLPKTLSRGCGGQKSGATPGEGLGESGWRERAHSIDLGEGCPYGGGGACAPSPPRLPNFHQNCELKNPIRITRGFPELCSPPATPQGELRVVLYQGCTVVLLTTTVGNATV